MKQALKTLSIVSLLVVLAAPEVQALQGPEIPPAVDASLRLRVAHDYNVGIVVGTVSESGTSIAGYGKRSQSDGRTPDRHTVFEIGSITKAFTGILLADMVGREEVRFDDPIDRYLPDDVRAPARGGRSITLVDLATQSSGLPRMPDNFAPADPSNPYADYTVDQLYEFLSTHELGRDIGATYEYSNYGMGLLGHVLARRAQTDYEQLVRERIADVLGMQDTRIGFTPAMEGRIAPGHVGPLPVSNWDIPILAGAGALRSTANDMLVFLAANMGLTASPLGDAMRVSHEPRIQAGSSTMHVGLGWHIRSGSGPDIVWHNGGTGGYRSFAGFTADGRRGVVVLTNSSASLDDVGFHLLDPSFPVDDVRVPVSVAAATLETYVGKYELQPRILFDIGLEQGQLTVQLTGQPRFPLYAKSDTSFFITVVDAEISFVRSPEGEVTSLVLHQGGVDQTARRLADDYQPPPPRLAIAVDPEVLATYVGRYQLAPGTIFDVTLVDGRLMVMLTGQPRFEVFPESETRFFYKVVEAQLTFVRDSTGAVTGLILHQGGVDRTAPRLP